MELKDLKTGFFGLKKRSVFEYISELNNEFAYKLEGQKKESEEKCAALSEKNAALDSENVMLRTENDALKKELESAREQLDGAEKRTAEANEKLAELKKELDDRRAQIDRLSTELERARAQRRESPTGRKGGGTVKDKKEEPCAVKNILRRISEALSCGKRSGR